MSTQQDHGDDAALAGEYVLHLLEDVERAAFEQRLAEEPALRDLVRAWDAQLVGLAEDVAPVTPRRAVKTRLEKTLFAAPPRRASGLWSWLAGGLVAAGVGVAALLLVPVPVPDGQGAAPLFAASVAAEDGTLVVSAIFIAQTNTLELTRQAGGALPGRVLELWLIADGAAAPVSLGVLPEGRRAQIALPPDLAQQLSNAVLAISDEPPGGSPTGAPTGAVLAVGPVTDA